MSGRVNAGILAGTGLVIALAWTILGRLDAALQTMHPPGEVSAGFTDIAAPAAIWNPEQAMEYASSWAAYEDQRGVQFPRTPGDLTQLYFWVDFGLAFSLAIFMLTLLSVSTEGMVHRRDSWGLGVLSALRWARMWVAVYFVADGLETALTSALWNRLSESNLMAIGVLSLTKWIAVVLVLFILTIAWRVRQSQALALVVEVQEAGTRAKNQLVPLRAQVLVSVILVVVFLALGGDLGRQVDDVTVRAVEEFIPMLLGATLACATSIAVYIGGITCIRSYISVDPIRSLKKRAYRYIVVAGVGLTAMSWLPHAIGLRSVGLMIILYSALSFPGQVRAIERDKQCERVRRVQLLRFLTLLPVIVLVLSLMRAGVTQWTGAAVNSHVFVWALGLSITAGVVYRYLPQELPKRLDPWLRPSIPFGIACTGTALTLFMFGFVSDPVWAMRVGTLFVLFSFTLLLLLLFTGLVILGDLIPPRAVLALPGLRRTPFVTAIIVVAVMSSIIDTRSQYFDVRLLAVEGVNPAELAAQAPKDMLDIWLEQHNVGEGDTSEREEKSTLPLVFLAGSGGGIRAAYWTAMVWDCLFGQDARQYRELAATCDTPLSGTSVFTASGVSGSSVGLAAVRANDVTPQSGSAVESWFDDALDGDFLAASMMAFLFRDLPNTVLRLQWPGWDRASSLERALQESQPGLREGLLSSSVSGDDPRFPFMLFNGTSVEDGCRLSVSALNGAATEDSNCFGAKNPLDGSSAATAAVRDASDFFCPRDGGIMHDVRLSTAALLSARYPFVSTAGDMTLCADSEIHTFAIDGGLFDNSATEALSQLLTQLGSSIENYNRKGTNSVCVLPQLVVVENGYAALDAPRTEDRPLQVTAPSQAISNVYDARSVSAREQAETLFEGAYDDARRACGLPESGSSTVTIYPNSVPGPQAPLGWTLSEFSRQELRAQLSSERNNDALDRIRSWFD